MSRRGVRVAMWSGPRNISTALMRAWENRPDTIVVDEPLYIHYLAESGAAHPGAEGYVRDYHRDLGTIIEGLVGPIPGGRTVLYQKLMAHHLLAGMDRDWIWPMKNCFLVRDPREMLLSLDRVTPNPGLYDTGLPQQVEIFREVRERTGRTPPVLDSRDVLESPRRLLEALCEHLGVSFREEMLSWPAGRRDSDGVWAEHWYAAVETSTGFHPYRQRDEPLPDYLDDVYAACLPCYEELYACRLGA